MIGRLHHVVLDCRDPRSLAGFYSALLGQPISYESDGWVVVSRDETTSGLAFQLAPDHVPPVWGNSERPQQVHLDVMVDDLDLAEVRVVALGARRLDAGQGAHRIFADPAGHPFCLIPRPGWAPPIRGID